MAARNEPDLDSALEAMSAEDLRAFVRDALERLDDEARSEGVQRGSLLDGEITTRLRQTDSLPRC